MRPPRASHLLPAGARLPLVSVALALIAAGCGGSPGSVEEFPPAQSYRIRGIVRQVSRISEDRIQLWIHHEAITDFVGIDGTVNHMEAMTMPFTVAESVDLAGIEPGIPIAFVLEVDWSAAQAAQITAWEPLAEGIRLNFEEAD